MLYITTSCIYNTVGNADLHATRAADLAIKCDACQPKVSHQLGCSCIILCNDRPSEGSHHGCMVTRLILQQLQRENNMTCKTQENNFAPGLCTHTVIL